MIPCLLILMGAVFLDRCFGDPIYPVHPVRLIGRSIRILEPIFRSVPLPEFWEGAAFTLTILICWESILFFSFKITSFALPMASLFSLYLLYSCIALRDLSTHVTEVIRPLREGNLPQSRRALQKIVGRDTHALDKDGIYRATIETVSEALVDGFLSPIFYFSLFALLGHAYRQPCLLGLMGALGYRIINTLDSMIGYKSDVYLYFGRFAARLDDIANFIPARLSIVFLLLAAWVLNLNVLTAVDITCRDRHHSASPNAGYPESFVAGALDIQLGGPVLYPFGLVEKPWMGNGTTPLSIEIVEKSLRLITLAGYIATGLFALALYLVPTAMGLPGL